MLAVVLESFHRALLITADGSLSLPLRSLGGTTGRYSPPRKIKRRFVLSEKKKKKKGFGVVSVRHFVPRRRKRKARASKTV